MAPLPSIADPQLIYMDTAATPAPVSDETAQPASGPAKEQAVVTTAPAAP